MPRLSSLPHPEASPPAGPALSVIRAPKPGEVLAAELRQRILEGQLKDGTALPAERDLMAQTGLTRGAVRQALQALQTEGLVETRAGRFGGSMVRRPADDALARYLGLFVQGRSIALTSLLEFRQLVGGPTAALAATHRTEHDLAQMQAIGDRLEAAMHDVPAFAAENVNWHVAVASATHNELIQAFVTAISGLIFKVGEMENVASEDVRKLVVRAHRSIHDAVVRQDAEAAGRRMKRHLEAISRVMLEAPGARATLL